MAACLHGTRAGAASELIKNAPGLGNGTQPEWLGKKLLSEAGIRVPAGDLARTPDEAAAVAKRIGYPIVLKAQAAALSHKTEAGGVMLNIADEAGLRGAWDTMMAGVKRAAPNVSLDGALVEKMSPKGIELMVGAKRDAGWGTVLLLGLGGIWVEALGDVQLLPGGASEELIREALGKLRSAKLLAGVRGAPRPISMPSFKPSGRLAVLCRPYRKWRRSMSIRLWFTPTAKARRHLMR